MNDLIPRAIIDAYGSLDRPNWSFTSVRLKRGMHSKVIEQLAEVTTLKETTDLNDDYSRCLHAELESESICLRVSLVGNFACAHGNSAEFYSEAQLMSCKLGRTIFELCNSSHIKILGPQNLREEIEFGGEQRTVYQVLFSSDGLL